MSPVVSVCPVHGAFASEQFKVAGVDEVKFKGQSEPCPQCGRMSKTMNGKYSFDGAGIATMLSGPKWSRDALDAVQDAFISAGRELADPDSVLSQTSAELERKLERIVRQGHANRRDVAELKDEVRRLGKRTKRPRFAAVLLGIGFALSTLSDLGGSIEFVSDLVEFVQTEITQGALPTFDELPPRFRTPPPSGGWDSSRGV